MTGRAKPVEDYSSFCYAMCVVLVYFSLVIFFLMSNTDTFLYISLFKAAPVAQWVKRWPTDLVVLEIFSIVNGVPLHTGFHYHPS